MDKIRALDDQSPGGFRSITLPIVFPAHSGSRGLEAAMTILKPQGRLVVVSFHSLEDRMVKQFMARHARQTYDRRTPFAPTVALPLRTLGKVKPSADEVRHNPRSRSAIMRVAERLAHAQEVA